jgi:hypothetical protein
MADGINEYQEKWRSRVHWKQDKNYQEEYSTTGLGESEI